MRTDRISGEAALLQNGYAFAIDTRDWDRFRDLFTPDVIAEYPLRTHHGIDEWLEDFIPFHAACHWTLHTMTNHLHGDDASGPWAACNGLVEWIHEDQPDQLHRWNVRYEDRLREVDGRLRIARRTLSPVRTEIVSPPPGTLPGRSS